MTVSSITTSPVFFLMLSPLVGLGNPQFWLRVPSAAFGAFAVMLVYLIGKRIAGRGAGLVAALILGLSPAALAFSQEARSYTMEMSLILVALLGIATLATDIPAASLPWRAKGATGAGWALFILGSAAALDVLGDGLPWVITANIIIGCMAAQSPNRRRLLLNVLAADAIITALSAPALHHHDPHAGQRLRRFGDVDSAFVHLAPLVRHRLDLSDARGGRRHLSPDGRPTPPPP